MNDIHLAVPARWISFMTRAVYSHTTLNAIQHQNPGMFQYCLTLPFQYLGPNAAFILARCLPYCRYATRSSLAVSWLQLLAATKLWLIAEGHCSGAELKSTVYSLPRWTKRWGYGFIGKTLLVAWSSLCGKWRLRSCTKIIIKVASGKLVWKKHKAYFVWQTKQCYC